MNINAIILAAGTSSRFAPLSYEHPKALLEVNGEIIIERQIEQLHEAGIENIYVITGYKAEQLSYLRKKLDVHIIFNNSYLLRNNHASIWAARHILGNTYICSADNYFTANPFLELTTDSYYAAQWATDTTSEWCMYTDNDGYIQKVTIGGHNAPYMMGHSFWNAEFSDNFLNILAREYNTYAIKDKLWEHILSEHLDFLKMKIKLYPQGWIHEFDTLAELQDFDPSYLQNTRSKILKNIAKILGTHESSISQISPIKDKNAASGFTFICNKCTYQYSYYNQQLIHIDERKH